MSAARSADEVVKIAEASGLLGAGSGDGHAPILLMCSAGRDSITLLDVAVRLVGPDGLSVLHVDHGLRAGAGADAEHITANCDAAGVAVVVRHAGPAPASGNLHAWARAARQRLASEEAERIGARVVATAHTRSDLVETAIGRLATQPGRRAMLSMRAREGRLVRPLFEITREETAAYCRARGLVWREDPSNAAQRYARARLRHGVVPILRGLNPSAEHAIARTIEELAEESDALDAIVAAAMDAPRAGEVGPSIPLDRLCAMPAALARLVLRALAESTLGTPCPRAGARLAAVIALRDASGRSGIAAVDVGGGARFELRAGVVRCRPSQGQAAPGA